MAGGAEEERSTHKILNVPETEVVEGDTCRWL